jgi:predicted DNA-binding transcriptional regulator AlpA
MSIDATPLLIRAEDVARMMGVSERTLWRLLSAGKVPQPVHIGRSTRWRLAEIREWIDGGCPLATR